MAVTVEQLNRKKQGSLFARAQAFQRGEQTAPLRKSRQRRAIGPGHVLAVSLVLAGFFLAFEKAYLFLISWEELAIRTVRIRCAHAPLAGTLEGLFQGRRMGNILLFDINALQKNLQAVPWIREARVRKVFPSSLVVEVRARTPFAVLDDRGAVLVDEHGIALERLASPVESGLPVVRIGNAHTASFGGRWETAKSVIMSLPPAEKSRLEAIECSSHGDATLLFRDDPVRILVDPSSVAEKLVVFRAGRPEWEGLFGALDTADLRFSDRVILSPAEQVPGNGPGNPDKEAE